MLTTRNAYNALIKARPDMVLLYMINYNSEYYVGQFTKDPDNPAYDDPYYAVNKQNGRVVGFVPDDLIEFVDAMENRSIDISRF